MTHKLGILKLSNSLIQSTDNTLIHGPWIAFKSFVNSCLEVLDYDHGLIRWLYNIPLFVKPSSIVLSRCTYLECDIWFVLPTMDWSTSEDQAGAISHIFSAPCQDLRPALCSMDCGLPFWPFSQLFHVFGHFDIKHLENNIRTLKTQKESCKRTLKTQVKGIGCAISRHICWSQNGTILVV